MWLLAFNGQQPYINNIVVAFGVVDFFILHNSHLNGKTVDLVAIELIRILVFSVKFGEIDASRQQLSDLLPTQNAFWLPYSSMKKKQKKTKSYSLLLHQRALLRHRFYLGDLLVQKKNSIKKIKNNFERVR